MRDFFSMKDILSYSIQVTDRQGVNNSCIQTEYYEQHALTNPLKQSENSIL